MLDPAAIRAALRRILSSSTFAASHRSKRLLSYIVENSFDDTHKSLKEYAIALAVFDRDASYDPSIDATVRVEAGRLRSRLRDYYSGEGRKDTLVISIPKGAYRATFVERPPLEAISKSGANPSLVGGYLRRNPRILRSWRRSIHRRQKRRSSEASLGAARWRGRSSFRSARSTRGRFFPTRGTAASRFQREEP